MKQKLIILSFTENGAKLSERLSELLPEYEARLFYKSKTELSTKAERLAESLPAFCERAFSEKTALLFVGAVGIAVRSIAGCVKDKLTDSPVLVIDERGFHVIPLLSGHVGGANELALIIAERFGADPVITTATDVNGAFSPDLFAKEHALSIRNRNGIAAVSGKALSGKAVTIAVKDYPPAEEVDIIVSDDPADRQRGTLLLSPKPYVVGIGCRKGKPYEEIDEAVRECLAQLSASYDDVCAFASIDLKAGEEGILELSRRNRIPFLTFAGSLLEKVPGSFSSSEFVKERIGVDNVCERAAMLAAGNGAELVLEKRKFSGVTVAAAKRRCGFAAF